MTEFKGPDFADPRVAAVFDGYPPDVRVALLRLRALIFEVAAETEGAGLLTETLKWGQPAYLTADKSGTTVRIDRDAKAGPGRFALYVHCGTDLVETYRRHYADRFTFGGKRSILFEASSDWPAEDIIAPLKHCIALALTYHRRKRS